MTTPLQDYMRDLTIDDRELLDATLERAYGLAETDDEKRKLFELAANVIRFYVKFDDMSDRLRWRKQSEDPAPNNEPVLNRYRDTDGYVCWRLCPSAEIDTMDDWRPL